MRRPIINRGHNAEIGRAKLIWLQEKRLEVARHGLDIAFDFGLDLLAYTCAVEIVRICREITERGGSCARVHNE